MINRRRFCRSIRGIGSAPRRPHRTSHRDRVRIKASAEVVGQTVCVLVNFRLKDVRWVYIQARASMKQKVERETMNERVLTCTSDVCVCACSYLYMCIYTCVITYMCIV